MKGRAPRAPPPGDRRQGLGQHPELAPLEPPAPGSGDRAAPPRSSANLVAHEAGKPPRDKARLYLNHAKHLSAPLGAMESPERKAWLAAAGRDHMTCADCHQLDAARERMAPVRYEQHCASCHPLAVTPSRSRSATRRRSGPTPRASRARSRTASSRRSS